MVYKQITQLIKSIAKRKKADEEIIVVEKATACDNCEDSGKACSVCGTQN